jgi:flagellar basal-body rod modification protein FlgD
MREQQQQSEPSDYTQIKAAKEKMMATAAGIFSHQMTAGQALTGTSATPLASSSVSANSSTDDTSSSSTTISATDFLTLLVTELKNQDPTADSDPNEYVNQLVAVNSLEQLININSTLTTDSSSTTASKSSLTGTGAIGSVTPAQTAAVTHSAASSVTGGKNTSGNLSVPEANASAYRVANALNGQK